MSAASTVLFDLQTDYRGRILTVLADSLELANPLVPGSYLAALVADRGAAGLLDFLLSLRGKAAALSSPLEQAGPPGFEPRIRLVMGGFLAGQGARVWGAESTAATRAYGANLLNSPGTVAPAAAWHLFSSATAIPPSPIGSPVEEPLSAAELRHQLAAARAEVEHLRRELAQQRTTVR